MVDIHVCNSQFRLMFKGNFLVGVAFFCEGHLFLEAFPFNVVNTKKLLQVFAIFLNAFSILKGRYVTGSAFAPATPAVAGLRSIAARRLAQNAPLEHFAAFQPSLPRWPPSAPFTALTQKIIAIT